jgi:hypothetical protein
MVKKIAFFLFCVFIVIAGISVFNADRKNNNSKPNLETESKSLCYLKSDKTDRNFFDEAWLRLDLAGEKVTGEFRNLPAEKDSKVGKFSGTVSSLNQASMSRTADVMWDSFAEGMNVTEELLIEFGDGNAAVLFGEMADRGDGVYIYKDKSKILSLQNLNQIACEDLQEKLLVEKYVRENIKTIATNNSVLGGSWYVLNVHVVPSMNSGEVLYEDGHIQSSASFEYDFNITDQSILVKNFKVKQ